MKIIKYKLCNRVNRGTEEAPKWEDMLFPVEISCTADNLEANEEIAKKEAYNGYTIEDDGKPEPEPAPSGDSAVWDELDAAYQEGYREGVDSV